MTVSGATRGKDWPDSRLLAWFALVGVIIYVGVDVLLKFLRPHYSLIYNAESDYGRGPWYWVMDLNFLLRCALSVAVARALSRTIRTSTRIRSGLTLLVVWAVCSGLLAFFADDIEGQPVHGSGKVHLALAFVAFVCVAIGTVLVSIDVRSDPTRTRVGNLLFIVSLLGAVAFVVLGAVIRHKNGPDGLYERIFLGLELLWIALATWGVVLRRPRPKASALTRSVQTPSD